MSSTEHLPKSQAQAIALGHKRFYPGPCDKGHDTYRRVSDPSRCVECDNQWSRANTAQRRAYEVRHHRDHSWANNRASIARSRSRAGSTITPDWIRAEFDRIGGRCPCCGTQMKVGSVDDNRTAPALDHLFGLDHPLTPETARLICGRCNVIKSDCTDPAVLRRVADFNDRDAATILNEAREFAARYPMPPDYDRQWARSRCDKTRFHYLINARKGNARRIGREFSLTVDDVAWPSRCPVLGTVLLLPLTQEWCERGDRSRSAGLSRPGPAPESVTFDRLNSQLGYLPGNVIVVSKRANDIKSDATAAEIRAVADWLEGEVARAACQTRTDDPGITNAVLYRLS